VLLSTAVAAAEPPPSAYSPAPPGAPGLDAPGAPLAPLRTEGVPPNAPEPTRVHSSALAAGGAVMGVVGVGSLVGGLVVLGIDRQQSSASSNPDSFPDLSPIIYWPLILHGIACIAGGAAMMTVGLKRVPNEPGRATTVSAFRARALPTVAPGPRSVTLRWTF
jgi:hypothetical protein